MKSQLVVENKTGCRFIIAFDTTPCVVCCVVAISVHVQEEHGQRGASEPPRLFLRRAMVDFYC